MTNKSGWHILLVAFLFASCAPKLEIDNDIQIACRSTDDCPAGFVCRTTCGQDKGFCVKSGEEDLPPTISNAKLSQSLAKVGDTIMVEFDINQPLRVAPQVVVDGIDNANFQLVEGDPSKTNEHYVFRYTVRGTEPESSFNVSIKAINSLCLTASESVGPITFDFSPPLLLNVESKQFNIGRTSKVIVSFTVSDENFSGEPEVVGLKVVCSSTDCTPETFDGFVKDNTVSPPEYRFIYTPTGEEEEGECRQVSLQQENQQTTEVGNGGGTLRQGVWYAVRISAVDDAGNKTQYIPTSNMWCFDFTPPQIEGAAANPLFVRSGDRLAFGFRTTEALVEDPQVRLVNNTETINLIGGHIAGLSYAYSTQIPENINGVFEIHLFNVNDLAGNGFAELVAKRNNQPITITIDNQPPQFTVEPHIVNADDQFFKSGEEILLEFTTNEEVNAEVYLDMGSRRFAFEQVSSNESPNGVDFRFKLSIAEEVLSEGSGYLRVFIHDNAGNSQAWNSQSPVIIDFTPPSVIEGTDWLLYIKPQWCELLSSVAAINNGGGALIGFSASEELLADPTVLLQKTDDTTTTIPCVKREQAGSGYTFICAAENLVDGTYNIVVNMQDLCGNQASIVLSKTVQVDTTPPAPLNLSRTTETGEPYVEFVRAPWGTNGDGKKELVVIGKAGAITDTDSIGIVAFSSDNLNNAGVLGGAEVEEDASFTIPLLPFDMPAVYLSAIDIACNVGEPRVVRFARWIATFGNKETGSITQNPHILYKTRLFTNAFIPINDCVSEPTTEEYSNQYGDTSVPIQVKSGAYWKQLLTMQRFPVPQKPYMVYDSINGKVVILAGISGNLLEERWIATSWSFDGYSMRDITPTGAFPSKRIGAETVFMPVFGSAFLLGGLTASTSENTFEVWGFNNEGWFDITAQQTQLPEPRYYHSATYDPIRGRVVVFGGASITENQLFNDVWEWDGESWYRVLENDPSVDCGSNQRPCARFGAKMAYSANNAAVLMFGGCSALPQSGNLELLNDTWLWNGEYWQRVNTTNTPVARYLHALSEAQNGAVALFGGADSNRQMLSDFWIWDGEQWIEKDSPTNIGRTNAGLAFNRARNELVLFGGANLDTNFDSLWIWNGKSWRGFDTWYVDNPTGRWYASAISVPDSGFFMFGGQVQENANFEATNDLWFWNGFLWYEIGIVGNEPEPSMLTAMLFNPASGNLLLSGGADNLASCYTSPLNALYSLDFSANDGTATSTQTTTPFAFCGATGITDLTEGSSLLVGAENTQIKIYRFDGTDWTELYSFQSDVFPQKPLAAALLPERDALLIAGANKAVFNLHGEGSPYHRSAPLPELGTLNGTATAYDPLLHRIVLFGGLDTASNTINDKLFLWDGDSWQSVETANAPPTPRYGAVMAWDSLSQQFIVFGGYSGVLSSQTFALNLSPNRKPAIIALIDYTRSYVQLENITNFVIQLNIGGTGYTVDSSTDDDEDLIGEPVNGASVLAWDNYTGSFIPLEGCITDAPADSPQPLECNINNVQAQRLVFWPTGSVMLAFVPNAPTGNGEGEAKVAISNFAFTVIYQNR